MKARVYCHDADFPGPPKRTPGDRVPELPSALPTASHSSPLPSDAPHMPPPHHPWAHCEIEPDVGAVHFAAYTGTQHAQATPPGAFLVGLLVGVVICAAPLLVLLRKVRRLKKMAKRAGGFSGGPPGGRWRFKDAGGCRAFPEYDSERLLKDGYGAPLHA